MMVKVAGALCLVLAAGHTLLGSRSILPRLRKEALPASPLGGPSSTEVALAFTWYFVTIAVVAIAILLFAIAGVWLRDMDNNIFRSSPASLQRQR